jgi:hypothetical protein
MAQIRHLDAAKMAAMDRIESLSLPFILATLGRASHDRPQAIGSIHMIGMIGI